jgi:hypothetical protein
VTIPSPLCLARTLYRSLVYPGTLWQGAAFSGHDLQEVEVHSGCTVVISRCTACGAQDISWHHGAPRPHEIVEAECCGRRVAA